MIYKVSGHKILLYVCMYVNCSNQYCDNPVNMLATIKVLSQIVINMLLAQVISISSGAGIMQPESPNFAMVRGHGARARPAAAAL